MKHALLEYEQNGYHDSDFFCVYFDDVTHEIGQKEIGSTRHAGGFDFGDIVIHKRDEFPAETLETARVALHKRIFEVLRRAEDRDVLTPGPNGIPFGTKVRVLNDSSKRNRKNHFKAGEVGEVTWSGQFGTFYARGYNTRSRENTSVGVRRLDGSRVFIPLSNLRLDREPLSDVELNDRAAALSYHYNFGACCTGFTWTTRNFFNAPEE